MWEKCTIIIYIPEHECSISDLTHARTLILSKNVLLKSINRLYKYCHPSLIFCEMLVSDNYLELELYITALKHVRNLILSIYVISLNCLNGQMNISAEIILLCISIADIQSNII